MSQSRQGAVNTRRRGVTAQRDTQTDPNAISSTPGARGFLFWRARSLC